MPGLSAVDSVSQQEFDLDKYGLELLVVDTQAHHQLNDGQYEQRRRTCEQAAELLGYEHLRAVAEAVAYSTDPEGSLAAVLNCLNDETMKKRVRHVITEIGRVDEFVKAFAAGDIAESGRLFNASHDSLRDDYEVTVPELDVAVDVHRPGGQGPQPGSCAADRRRVRGPRLPRAARARRRRLRLRQPRGLSSTRYPEESTGFHGDHGPPSQGLRIDGIP